MEPGQAPELPGALDLKIVKIIQEYSTLILGTAKEEEGLQATPLQDMERDAKCCYNHLEVTTQHPREVTASLKPTLPAWNTARRVPPSKLSSHKEAQN